MQKLYASSFVATATTVGIAVEDLPSSQAPTATCTMDSTSVNSETAAQSVTKVIRDNQALAIVLPIALLTIMHHQCPTRGGKRVHLCFLKGKKRE